jgi:imidazolonepropionase-like amidohydrolase
MNSMSRRIFVAAIPLMGVGFASVVRAQGNPPGGASATLFQNVRIFDGKNSSLSAPSSVLIKGNVIERISTAPSAAEPGVTMIAGGGRTLMPGLIDAHWHALLVRPTPAEAIAGDIGFNNLVAGAEATDTLMRGFTTVRDMGGPTFGLKRAIDLGIVPGPRIYPSGAMITITGGHGDFRQLSDLPRDPKRGHQRKTVATA